MNKIIKKQTIEKFLESLSSKSPIPGGGTAAALAGTLAASLVEMVTNLTIGNQNYVKVKKEIEELNEQSTKFKKRLLELADEDSKAFEEVVAAYRIEKSNQSRESRIEKALKQATEIPLETALLSNEVNKLARVISKIGNKHAQSDALSALYLSKAATFAALENVKINLRSITDKRFKKRIEDGINNLGLPNCRC